ncbi:hypothetical protein FNL55_26110 [Tardiphaga sp. vice352]|nr:hypothetical protein FNL53_26660 [Tardiphaga sp. vice278]QDM24689.1 hypothetical protein FIU28_25340 [Tardiphaga sp. vice154]QDM29884.1 hypothetical protein FNL56_26835 [Tardiphaga sp. vice304]QDM34975.1 hypothetical protein FNL55_26110 [Tardiphaga sp. vice352]
MCRNTFERRCWPCRIRHRRGGDVVGSRPRDVEGRLHLQRCGSHSSGARSESSLCGSDQGWLRLGSTSVILDQRGVVTVNSTPKPDLPDHTLIVDLELPARILNALQRNGFATVGEVRETSDQNILSMQDIGPRSLKFLRTALGGPNHRD